MDKNILVRLLLYPITYIMWGGYMWYSQIITPYNFTHLVLLLPLHNAEFYSIIQNLNPVIIEFFKIIYLYGFSSAIIFGVGYYLFIKKDFLKSDIIVVDLAIGWFFAGLIYCIAIIYSPFQVGIAKNLINFSYFWIFTKPTYEVPSLHTAYTFLLALHYKDEYPINIIFYILSILIPIATLIMGMHWVIDVITGYIFGYLIYKFPKNIHLKVNKVLNYIANEII